MHILLTGVTGFAGGHLAEALLGRPQVELVGVSRRAEWPGHWRHLAGRVALCACDLRDPAAVEQVVRHAQPDWLFHLAGYAHAGRSLQEPETAWEGNLEATRSLYDAVHRWGGRPRILYVGSGLAYGDAADPGRPFHEDSPLRPVSPYASSKAAADLLSYQYTRTHGLDIVRVRPFNHIGPRQSPEYAVANFARQIAAIEQGRQPAVLETGNLSSRRDLTDVRDVARAYVLLADRGRRGEVYNVASGECHTMQVVLDLLLRLARARVEVRPRASLLRATEASVLRGDAAKLRQETGWAPSFSLEQTLADTLAYWRQQP
ncbi:MAG TPA: GDP-mannose 4,6-dehydratase [Gemmataceae bacterium]|jgi:GDP-4-dehydro-6-deoxy-D-mannose reductase|nr:GDP-mannose 4,6-dehydratase [Gemmataceae bacterium]